MRLLTAPSDAQETQHVENWDGRRGTNVLSKLTLNFAGLIWNWNSGAFELFPASDHFLGRILVVVTP
jgi:hypothetical protein